MTGRTTDMFARDWLKIDVFCHPEQKLMARGNGQGLLRNEAHGIREYLLTLCRIEGLPLQGQKVIQLQV